jgi:NAD(P)H-nitrite reductase
VLVGCAKEYNDLLQMMLNGLEIPENPESLIMPGFDQAAAKTGGSGVDLFQTAQHLFM